MEPSLPPEQAASTGQSDYVGSSRRRALFSISWMWLVRIETWPSPGKKCGSHWGSASASRRLLAMGTFASATPCHRSTGTVMSRGSKGRGFTARMASSMTPSVPREMALEKAGLDARFDLRVLGQSLLVARREAARDREIWVSHRRRHHLADDQSEQRAEVVGRPPQHAVEGRDAAGRSVVGEDRRGGEHGERDPIGQAPRSGERIGAAPRHAHDREAIDLEGHRRCSRRPRRSHSSSRRGAGRSVRPRGGPCRSGAGRGPWRHGRSCPHRVGTSRGCLRARAPRGPPGRPLRECTGRGHRGCESFGRRTSEVGEHRRAWGDRFG